MAVAYLDDEQIPPRHTDNPQSPPQPAPAPAPSGTDWGGVERQLREEASKRGLGYDPSDLEDVKRNTGYDRGGISLDQALANAQQKYNERAAPTSHRRADSQTGYNQQTNQPLPSTMQAMAQAQGAQGAGRTNFQYNAPGDQFDDPYTKALEDLVKQQLEGLKQPQANPALDQLLQFLNTQFQDLSQNPGYSPSEQAILRTQALDPIERDRTAAQRRSLERTASRGFMPSSGLAELDSREVDLAYDQLRGAAQRDLGVGAIDQRNQDLARALTMGQLSGVTIPQMQRGEDQQRRNESLSLASLLYQLPRNAMNDSLAVMNGSPLPGDMFSQAVQLISAQENQRRYNQQQNQQFWESIGETLAGLFG